MGKLGEEVSQKIKSAIKAKLMELGIHIDNELPDYVMVLVANKKTQQQMEDDLSLFLGDSTKAFTSWLHNVLKKLEQVTISTKAKKKDKLRKRGLDNDSNGVSSTKKVKSELDEVKKEPAEGSGVFDPEPELEQDPELEPERDVPNAQGTNSENEDAVSLTDHTEHHEPESTSEPVDSKDMEEDDDEEEEIELEDKEEVSVKPRKTTSEEPKQHERIKIVWDKEEHVADRPHKSRNDHEVAAKSKKSERATGREKSRDRVREKDRDRRTRSRSRSRTRFTSKKTSREEDERDRSRIRSRDRYARKQSSSPKRKSSSDRDRKVVDARDILKRKGADKKLAAAKSRRRDSRSPPYSRRRSRSKSREPHRENKISSVLKAVIRVEKPPPTVASTVKVTPRPVRHPSTQPNCNLILKAVADAEKSLATSSVNTKKVKESYEDKPSKKDRKRYGYGYAGKGNISVTLLNDRVVASKTGAPMDVYHKEDEEEEPEVEKYENETSQEALAEEDTMSMALDADDYIDTFDKEDQYVMEAPITPVKEYHPTKKIDKTDRNRFIISLDSTASDNENDNELDSTRPVYEVSDDVTSTTTEPVVEKKLEKRQFDRSRLGPKIQISATSPTPNKKPIPETLAEMTAALTRCKYWPNCDAGDGCPYVHPSSLCRAFPTCHFGDKCLYIHPACKFADNCLNVKCPYAHTSKTPVAKAPRPFLPISNTQLCVYFPNCSKPFCPFVHVKKPCRFGAACMKLGCEFDHGNANRNPFKWVANAN